MFVYCADDDLVSWDFTCIEAERIANISVMELGWIWSSEWMIIILCIFCRCSHRKQRLRGVPREPFSLHPVFFPWVVRFSAKPYWKRELWACWKVCSLSRSPTCFSQVCQDNSSSVIKALSSFLSSLSVVSHPNHVWFSWKCPYGDDGLSSIKQDLHPFLLLAERSQRALKRRNGFEP